MENRKPINNSELCAFDISNVLLQTCEQLQAGMHYLTIEEPHEE